VTTVILSKGEERVRLSLSKPDKPDSTPFRLPGIFLQKNFPFTQ
jgi:hypothetical protein